MPRSVVVKLEIHSTIAEFSSYADATDNRWRNASRREINILHSTDENPCEVARSLVWVLDVAAGDLSSLALGPP